MKQLTQDIFKGAPDWAASAAIDKDGSAYWYNAYSNQLVLNKFWGEHIINSYVEDLPNYPEYLDISKFIGMGYNDTDWQNSAIDREVVHEH